MKKMILKRRSSYQGGFTLIEMVIVIAVIGILMGIAFNGISSIQQNARDTRRLADLRKVQTHLELYFNRCGHYPNGQACGAAIGTGSGALDWDILVTALSSVVSANEVPTEPLVAKQGKYHYDFGNGGLDYVVSAKMEKLGSNRDVTGTPYITSCDTYYCIRS
jgi:prepilin-type N-terminal cleavage/methylation domain-containing protein